VNADVATERRERVIARARRCYEYCHAPLFLVAAVTTFHTAVDPETGAEVSLFNPRTHAWQAHFTLSADHAHIIGITPIGRATVAALRFNNPEHVDARQLWVAGGWYPPPDVA